MNQTSQAASDLAKRRWRGIGKKRRSEMQRQAAIKGWETRRKKKTNGGAK